MLEHVDPSQIPKYFGGTQTDENGDPKCMHKVTVNKNRNNHEICLRRIHKNENGMQICDAIL